MVRIGSWLAIFLNSYWWCARDICISKPIHMFLDLSTRVMNKDGGKYKISYLDSHRRANYPYLVWNYINWAYTSK